MVGAVGALLLVLVVICYTSLPDLIHVKFNDALAWLERQVPVETQIKQLRLQVDKIDDEIKANLGKLARLEVDAKDLEQNVAALKEDQSKRKSEIAALAKKLDEEQSNVGMKDHRVPTSRLETLVNTYQVRSAKLKSLEELLAAKRQTLEAAHEKISVMKSQREALALSVQKLETRKELVDIQTQQSQIEVSNDIINRCNAMAKKIDDQLSVQEKTGELYGRYGYSNTPVTTEKETKNLKDVLNSAKKILEEEGTDQ
jgi:chromosome segregation ATPase